jgi:putative MATE family efflux protein
LTATVARTIGAGHREDARRIAAGGLLSMIVVTLIIGVGTVIWLRPLLTMLGASGTAEESAVLFLRLTSPSLPLIAAGMASAALLRCIGDAQRAMNVTLFAAILTAVIDPILIFGCHLGLTGAALSTLVSRLTLAVLGLLWVVRHHHLLGPLRLALMVPDIRSILVVAAPAVMTNMATPVAGAYVTHAMARFGPAAVAGLAIIDRVVPVAFGLIFALTGAVGPILAQNLGAGRIDRVRDTLRHSLIVMVVAVSLAWAILAGAQDLITRAFSAQGVTGELLTLFCHWTAGSFLFMGALFVGNAAFNNLGRPLLSTAFNWGRATLGTIPCVALGQSIGPRGVLIGQAAGSVLFGIAAALTAFRVAARLRAAGAP